MAKRIKAIVLDLDGTLLCSEGNISGRTLKALNGCKERGILIIVATARFWFRAEKYLEIIKPDYAVLADGTQIYRKDRFERGFPMDSGMGGCLISELHSADPKVSFVVSTGKTLLTSETGINEPWRKTSDFSTVLNEPVYKIAAVLDSYGQAAAFAERYSLKLYSYHGENLYGFTDKSAGKYPSVCTLAEMLGIDMEEIVSFGDDENDLDLVSASGTGVAVANAIESVRNIADYVTASNDDDGVAEYIEEYMLS